ncbi:MAG TPA: hypothetical protein VIX60_03225 [Candidatus Cybelea sp.]
MLANDIVEVKEGAEGPTARARGAAALLTATAAKANVSNATGAQNLPGMR